MVIENGPKSGIRHKAALRLILVLEEWLDEESAVLHVSSNSHHCHLELLLFLLSKLILGVQDRGSRIIGQSLGWILLQIFGSEDLLDFFVEVEVSHLGWLCRVSVVILQQLILLRGQLYLLGVEGRSELGCIDLALSQWVVVLEEFADSDSVSLHHIHHLGHEGIDGLSSGEIDIDWLISRLGTGIWLIDVVSKHRAVVQEWQVLNIAKLSAVDHHDGGQLGVRDVHSE